MVRKNTALYQLKNLVDHKPVKGTPEQVTDEQIRQAAKILREHKTPTSDRYVMLSDGTVVKVTL